MSDPHEPDSSELQALLRRAARGDSQAWRAIVAEFAPRLFGLLRAHCHDSELAEEIAQSTFCTLAAKIGEYVETGRFESWIFRIAMNRLRDEMRRRARHARSMGVGADAEGASGASRAGGGGSPLHELPDRARRVSADAATELGQRLSAAMARLPEADREIIELRHTGELSFKQLSDYYDEPVGTLLARHHRALKKLRAILEDSGVRAEDIGGEES